MPGLPIKTSFKKKKKEIEEVRKGNVTFLLSQVWKPFKNMNSHCLHDGPKEEHLPKECSLTAA